MAECTTKERELLDWLIGLTSKDVWRTRDVEDGFRERIAEIRMERLPADYLEKARQAIRDEIRADKRMLAACRDLPIGIRDRLQREITDTEWDKL